MGIKNNSFWKLRTKHGRDKIFKTPEILWEAACQYFQWADDNPLIEVDYRGKDASRVEIPKKRPFTILALCIYLGVNSKYFNDFKDAIRGKEDEESLGFSEVITRIDDIIRNQKFEGAAAGFFNSNIIARDLGLIDKRENENKGSISVINLGSGVSPEAENEESPD